MGNEAQVNHPAFGRLTETRVGTKAEGPYSEWAATPAPPVSGLAWMNAFTTESDRLSIGLETDANWYAQDFTACMIKGVCDLAPVREALRDEGVFPVSGFIDDSGPYALASIWLNTIRDSVCGKYHEVIASFDVSHTQPDAVGFRSSSAKAPWAILYNHFGPSVCDSQFLHSLWIDSPVSISWGREMQAFPKHPLPTDSLIQDDSSLVSFHIQWPGKGTVMRGRTAKKFGLGGLCRESLGLLATQKLGGVFRFLTGNSMTVPIRMPAKTAEQNKKGRDYLVYMWKGIHPMAVQVWPWSAEDAFDLGDAKSESGCEDHNANLLLKEAKFRPLAVIYTPKSSAFVETGKARK